MAAAPEPPESRTAWLLLAHQLPPKPAYFRVKIWRRLQDLGAVAIKASLYALPANADTREDFQWLLREIQQGGGEATLFEARLVDGLTDGEVRALFDKARDADYDKLNTEARTLAEALAPAAWSAARPPSTTSTPISARNASEETADGPGRGGRGDTRIRNAGRPARGEPR
jgi:hypothetical protein